MATEDALNKLRRYCAYQERCHEEVRTKLLSLKIYGETLEEIINQLISEDFLNEERFAIAYSGGKFRMLGWGKIKIEQALKAKKISTYCIKKALSEIDDEAYHKTLKKHISRCKKKYQSGTKTERHQKTAQFLIAKGFESNIVWQFLSQEK